MLRASGVNYDIRKDEPYSIYDRFDFDVPTGTTGDCYDRYLVRLEEMRAVAANRGAGAGSDAQNRSADAGEVCRACCAFPPSECYMRTENPRGEYGIYLVSKGGNKPYRCKMRSPSFCNLMALREMTIGEYVADAVIILGSVDIVLCEVDR